jgi:hypothetical protein
MAYRGAIIILSMLGKVEYSRLDKWFQRYECVVMPVQKKRDWIDFGYINCTSQRRESGMID